MITATITLFLVTCCCVAAEMRNPSDEASPRTVGVFFGAVLSMIFYSIITAFVATVFS